MHSSVYMLIPISQFIPPAPPSALASMFVLYVCVSSSTLQIRLSIPFFLDSAYTVNVQYLIFFFWTYFTLYDSLYVHPHLYKWYNSIPFYDWVPFYCIYIYIPHLLYPFLCWCKHLNLLLKVFQLWPQGAFQLAPSFSDMVLHCGFSSALLQFLVL